MLRKTQASCISPIAVDELLSVPKLLRIGVLGSESRMSRSDSKSRIAWQFPGTLVSFEVLRPSSSVGWVEQLEGLLTIHRRTVLEPPSDHPRIISGSSWDRFLYQDSLTIIFLARSSSIEDLLRCPISTAERRNLHLAQQENMLLSKINKRRRVIDTRFAKT